MTPYFTIIIPTYNRAALLPSAIRSVLDQSFKNWELIIVDDGSSDNTSEVVQPFLQDARIRYHWQKNKELNGARNTGIRLAQGTYLAFLDDDDRYLPDHLATLSNFLQTENTPVAAVRTGMYLQVNEKQREKAPLLNIQDQHPVKALWDTPVNLLSFVFHKEIFAQNTFEEDFILAEDFHFLIRVFLAFPVYQLTYYTVFYSTQEDRRSNLYYQPDQLRNKIAALQATWEQNKQLLQQHIPASDLAYKITKEYLHFAKSAFRAKDKSLGWEYFREAIKRREWRFIKSYLGTLWLGLWA